MSVTRTMTVEWFNATGMMPAFPIDGEHVLAAVANDEGGRIWNHRVIAYTDRDDRWYEVSSGDEITDHRRVTHWCHIPPMPLEALTWAAPARRIADHP